MILAGISVLEIVLYILIGVGCSIWVALSIVDIVKKKKKKGKTDEEED